MIKRGKAISTTSDGREGPVTVISASSMMRPLRLQDWLVRLTANRKTRGFELCVLYLRYAWLDQNIFETREEAQEHATEWL
jgi:hypothetical protein